jgi:hypothetical protein
MPDRNPTQGIKILATKFTYKMRSGGNETWGRGPAQYKQNYFKNLNII